MKKKLKMILTCTLALAILVTATLTAASQSKIKSFSDVPKNYWGYQTIMDMTKLGLFKGTTEAVNGVATFSPEKTMTRAEFITVVLRAAYPVEAGKVTNTAGVWWKGYYDLALKKSLLAIYELDSGDLNKPMTREEMAMVLVRCVNMQGETAEKWVSTDKIADYSTIKAYYRSFVRECFSLGLICGVDAKGTFAPSKSLTRAEAATVLNRLIDKTQRIAVEFDDNAVIPDGNGNSNIGNNPDNDTGNTGSSNGGNTGSGSGNNTTGSNNNNGSGSDDTEKLELPWDKEGSKQPKDYTWAEYAALSIQLQMAFQRSFGNDAAFESWMNQAQAAVIPKNPWEEEGAKQPWNYTWAEFEALTTMQQLAFQETFESSEAFLNWMNSVGGNASEESDDNNVQSFPWNEPGAKQPIQYTWAEFEGLTGVQQVAFQNTFVSSEAFEAWMTAAQGNSGNTGDVSQLNPWEIAGSKQPSQYTWEEFETLNAEQKENFYDWFGSTEAFETWMTAAQKNSGNTGDVSQLNPWEIPGGKQPSQYTWEEFEALNAEQKENFYDWFGSTEAFETWMTVAQGNSGNPGDVSQLNPWDIPGGKQPSQYTWEEFEALNAEQKENFYDWFGSTEAFETWMTAAQA